jgi:hypothetical protein
MIDRSGDGYELICDNCEDSLDFDTFGEAVQYKKARRWRPVKSDSGTWYDLCPRLLNAGNNKQV